MGSRFLLGHSFIGEGNPSSFFVWSHLNPSGKTLALVKAASYFASNILLAKQRWNIHQFMSSNGGVFIKRLFDA
jgi:hypothetical protein